MSEGGGVRKQDREEWRVRKWSKRGAWFGSVMDPVSGLRDYSGEGSRTSGTYQMQVMFGALCRDPVPI